MIPNAGSVNMANPIDLYKNVVNTGFHMIKQTIRSSKSEEDPN